MITDYMSCDLSLACLISLDIDGEFVQKKLSKSNNEAKDANNDKAVENLNVKMSGNIAS